MLRPIMLMFLAGTFLGTSAIYAAENSDKQATKDAARQLCVTEVRKRYENAEVSSQRAKRKKIGKVRGYAFRIKTNEPPRFHRRLISSDQAAIADPCCS